MWRFSSFLSKFTSLSTIVSLLTVGRMVVVRTVHRVYIFSAVDRNRFSATNKLVSYAEI